MDFETALAIIERHRHGSPVDPWQLVDAERSALDAADPLTTVPAMGSVVIDREGDAWHVGRTRMSCMSAVDGVRIHRVARVPASPGSSFGPDGRGALGYGPFKLLREGGRGTWLYTTIRGHR